MNTMAHLTDWGRWNRETWQRGTRLNRSQRVEHPSAQEKIEHAVNDKRIILFATIRQRRIQSPAISGCSQPFCRRSYGVPTAARRQQKQQQQQRDDDEDRQAPVPAATTSGTSESATAAAATTLDDCCRVCIVAPRAGFALVPCGHRTRRQYTRQCNDDKENF